MTYYQGGAMADGPERLPMYCTSRPLIESVVRRHAAAREDLHLRGDHRFTDYRTDDAGAVGGVEFRDDEGSEAALDALLLHHALADGGIRGVAPRLFARADEFVDAVRGVSVGADFELSQTSGPKPFGTDLFNRYLDRLIRQAQTDGVLRDAFFRVFRLEEPPTSLFRPGVVWRVLRPTGGGSGD